MLNQYRLFAKRAFRVFCLLLLCVLISLGYFINKNYFFINYCSLAFIIYTIFLILKEHKHFSEEEDKQKMILQYSRMQTIINNIKIALYLKDTRGKILIANSGHEDIFGQNLKNLTGKKVSEIFKNTEAIDKEDLNIIKNKVSYETIKKFSLKNSGRENWIKINKSPVFDRENKVCAIVVTMTNYNKFIETEEKKNTFVATITHDLKTPTNAQIQALDLLLNDRFGELKQKQREILTEIKNSCKYMSTLIFSILDTYSAGDGQTKLSYEEFDFAKLVEECAAEISYLSIEKNQRLSIVFPHHSLIVSADRTQIKRVIINLVANAIFYGRNNTVIEVSVEDNSNSDLSFSVKNHSRYIPKEKINTLFEKYQTGFDSKIQKTGTGLGLYLSKQIILKHKGKITADSSPDNVCTFSFSIPKNIKEENPQIVELVS